MKTEIHCLLDDPGSHLRLEQTTFKDPGSEEVFYMLSLKMTYLQLAGWQGSRLSSGLAAMRDALDELRQKVQKIENERALIPAAPVLGISATCPPEEGLCLCNGGKNVMCARGKEIDQGKRDLLTKGF